ncbi:MAG: hypothetical protein KJP06_04580 [Deltaproteobacteria bacterium]|nr:hypothetical protein [Deltaproteobacteria bacterium]
MQPIYHQIRQRARQIILRHPTPDFYHDHSEADEVSKQFFDSSREIKKLLSFLAGTLENDFGHGLMHAVKVSHDAGALMVIEARHSEYAEDPLLRLVCLAQTAGLLHDVKRKKKDHSTHAATHAKKLLKKYSFSGDEISHISTAIQNHEAFKEPVDANSTEGQLISNCLYDADKFRWGPDNFHDTLWDMVSYFNPPLTKFMEGYPQGMEKIKSIKSTFRTSTGKKYGPQFIDLGLSIGEELYEVIQTEFSSYL